MIIKKSIVPNYLTASKFYRTLLDDDTNVFIPDNALKSDENIESDGDLIHLFITLHFWEADFIPNSLINYYLYLLNDDHIISLSLLFCDRLNYISVLKALKESSDHEKINIAAASKYIDILKFLKAQTSLEWDVKACTEAAKANQLENLKYLHENGCPWDYEVCANAAGSGSIDCLIYAHENGCPWNGTCITAAENGLLQTSNI